MDDRDGFIWLDGKLVPWRDSRMHVLTHALHYGSAVFEGERIYDGRVFRLAAHSQRLIIRPPARLRGPWTREQIEGDAQVVRQRPAAAGPSPGELGGDGRVGHRHAVHRHRAWEEGRLSGQAAAGIRPGQAQFPVGRAPGHARCGALPDLRLEGPRPEGRFRRRPDARLEGRSRRIDGRQHLPGDRREAGDADAGEFPRRHHTARRHGDGQATRLYQVRALPSTFFIDRDGVIRRVVVGGPLHASVLETTVLELIGRTTDACAPDRAGGDPLPGLLLLVGVWVGSLLAERQAPLRRRGLGRTTDLRCPDRQGHRCPSGMREHLEVCASRAPCWP
jgi:hypothetical protein